jgi:N-acetyl-anhydromuramyl-L-alanine amidase AmpD
MIHRIGVGETAESIAEWFAKNGPDWIGTRSMPYHFVVRRLGMMEQALPLVTMAPHGWKWNRQTVSIAVPGDFRHQSPGDAQVAAIIVLCARIQDRLGRRLTIVGHTDVDGATKDASKVCPGPLFPMKRIKEASYSMGVIQC